MRRMDFCKAVKAWVALPALCLIILLPGCSFIPANPSELIKAPKLTAEQQAIEGALGKSYTLQYPREGDYRSAFILKDLNKDGKQEALAFYRPQNENAGTHVMVLTKKSKGWVKNTDISGDGNDVDMIDFGDFDGNGSLDIAIAWTQLTSGNDIGLSVYAENKGKYIKEYKSTTTFTKMKLADLNGDGRQDILLAKLASDDTAAPNKKSASATLVSFHDGRMEELANTPLDSSVSSYANLYTTKIAKNKVGILIDGYKGAHQVVTELVYYDNGMLLDPLLTDDAKGVVTSTLRDETITCQDIDNDGIMEIPQTVELAGYGNITDYDKKLWLVRWMDYSVNGAQVTFSTKMSCVINQSQRFWFTFPNQPKKSGGPVWADNKNVTIVRSIDDKIWTFKEWNADTGKVGATLFTLYSFSGDTWNGMTDAQHQQYRLLGQANGANSKNSMIYAIMINDPSAQASSLNLSFDQIKTCFKIVD